MLGALPPPVRGGVDDERAGAVGRWDGRVGGEVDPRRDHLGLGHPADRVVGADDLGVGALAVCELLGGLAADVGAHVVVDGVLPRGAQDRELQRLRHEREPEVEVEDVGARQQARERAPLRQLTAREPAAAVERPVRLRVECAPVEDDEPCVDAAPAQRLDVLPRDACRVDRAVDDAERSPRGLRLAGDDSSPFRHSPVSPAPPTMLIPVGGWGLGMERRRGPSRRIPLDLVEVAQRRPAGPDTAA